MKLNSYTKIFFEMNHAPVFKSKREKRQEKILVRLRVSENSVSENCFPCAKTMKEQWRNVNLLKIFLRTIFFFFATFTQKPEFQNSLTGVFYHPLLACCSCFNTTTVVCSDRRLIHHQSTYWLVTSKFSILLCACIL